jgi:hypothetical protein
MTYARRARTGGAVSSRRRLGRPVEYPDDHPYNDPRRRVADALGMREAMRPRYAPEVGSDEEAEEKTRDFIAFMGAVLGRDLSDGEVHKIRDGFRKGLRR